MKQQRERTRSLNLEAIVKNIFDFADDLGPIKIVHIYDPKSGLKAVVAVDNVARGPSIGGIRMESLNRKATLRF